MLWGKNVLKTNSTNVGSKTCLKEKQYKCCEKNMLKKCTNVGSKTCLKDNSINVVSKTCLKDKQYKCWE